MSLENYEQSLDCKMGTIPRIGPRVIKGITIGERHSEVEQTFGRKPKSRRAELVTREAKRALEYIQERQLAEKAALTAAEEGSVLTDDASLNSFLARPKEPLSEKPFKKSTASVLMDLFEDKKGRNYEVNFLGSPVKERWFKEEEYGGVNFMEPSLADTVDTTNSTSSSTQSKRRKGNLFITDQGSVMSSQKFITQRSHVLAEGLHVTDETPDRIKKYFGDDSKGRFYDTYRELRRQKLLLPITKDTHGRIVTDLNKLISCTSTDHPVNKSIADLVALGVIRPSTSSPSANPAQRMDSAVSELFNINSFSENSAMRKDSVASSITSIGHMRARVNLDTQPDDDSVFSSDDDSNAPENAPKPIFPFVSIFSNEKISERRKSQSAGHADIHELGPSTRQDSGIRIPPISPNGGALKQTHISPIPHSNIGMEDTDIVPAATSVPVAVTGVSAGSKLTTRGKNSGALHPSEAHASSPAAKAKKASARRSSVAGTLTIAQKTKKTADNVRKQVSCVGRLNVGKKITKASNVVAALDKDLVQAVGEPVAPAVTPKKLTSNDEFVSFASDHPFDIPGLRASSIDEGSEGDEHHQFDMQQMSSALPEDESSDDEDIRLGGDNEGFMTYGCDSPRAKFLAGCIEMNIPPRNALILRAKVTSVLFLEHHGMGDKLALLLAPALAAMPLVSGINIGDNNLTDVGLEPIINSIANCLHVRDFNMSENIIGPKAAAALAKLLGNPDCRLETVTLRKCDIDDGECERFVDALKTNRHLKELDMSDNLLGKDENLNAVKPDIVTAGEALASLLREGCCPLTKLKIAWNMIRMGGAYELCTAFEVCRTLEHIDISFNALGRESGIALGTSIMLMPALKELVVSNNGLDPMATFTLCVGARECPSMTYLCLDNNPVGDLGMRAILTNVVYCGSRLHISARGCDFTAASCDCSYRRNDPAGPYDIDLASGFHRAILLDAMDAVAMHQSLTIEGFVYSYDGNDLSHDLTKFDEKRSVECFDRHETHEIDTLQRMHRILSNDRVKTSLISTFLEKQHPALLDAMQIGLYRDETTTIIQGIGRVEYGESQFKTLFAYFDICDDSTIITSFLFTQIIEKIETEALLRIRDASNIPRFSVNGGKSRYIPPNAGRIRMRVVDTFINRSDGYSLTSYQTELMYHMSQNHADVSVGLEAVMQLFSVRCEEATKIFHILLESTGDPANALASIIPCLTTSPDIRAITNMYGRNPTTQRRLEQRMGNAYKAYIGPTDGYYHIDLRVATDRLCLQKLMQISASNSHSRKLQKLGDVSQNGDWSSFRNKHYVVPAIEGQIGLSTEILLNNAALTPMPTQGVIEFDFSGASRKYIQHSESNTNQWFVNSLIQLGLISEARKEECLRWLVDMEIKQRKNSTGAGGSLWQRDLGRSSQISSYLYEKVYHQSQLNKRHSRFIEGLVKERGLQAELAAKAKAEADAIDAQKQRELYDKRARSRGGSRAASRIAGSSHELGATSRPSSRQGNVANLISETAISENVTADEEDEEFFLDDASLEGGSSLVSGSIDGGDSFIGSPLAAGTAVAGVSQSRHAPTGTSKKPDRYAPVKASKFLRAAIDIYDNGRLLYARQVALLVKLFNIGCIMRSDYGSYRVELVISLFSKIKDIQNFDIVMSYLNATEAACVLGRLGYLTLFNPMKPENCYDLDLALWEQRQVAKMLIHYAVTEPGINWFNQKYAVDRFIINIPGWELTSLWNAKENLPEKGILTCRYYAGDGFCMKQCRPVKSLRFNLLALALISLDEMRDEEAEFLCDKTSYRRIGVADEITATPMGVNRKHHAKFSASSKVQGSTIPTTAGTLEGLNNDLARVDITWNYNFLSDSHP